MSWQGGGDINIQRFDSTGAAVGTTVKIDGASTSDISPKIASTGDGGYVVAWGTTPSTDVFAQKYDKNGVAVGTKATLKNPNDGIDELPDVAGLSDGSYVVAWQWNPGNGNGNVAVQKFSSTGTAVGSVVTLTGPVTNVWDRNPSVTALNDGGYVVTWEAYVNNVNTSDVFVQRFDKNNATVGAMKQLAGSDSGDTVSEVMATTDGGYVVVWRGSDVTTNQSDVYVQKFDVSNNEVGGKQKLSATTATGTNDHLPQVTALPNGGYAVTWYGSNPVNTNTDVFVQAFDGAGVPAGTAASTTGNFTITSSLTALPAGQTVTDYVVTYTSGSLTVGGVSYASGATIAKATWDAAVTAKTALLSGASATNYSFTLVANVTDSVTGLSFPVEVNRMGTGLVSPLVIDLNGDGIHTLNLEQGVVFDLSGVGTKVQTGWVDRHDGLLAIDRNGDGQINDGTELLGNATTLANGTKAADGWAALAGLDSNADGVVNALDAQFAQLRVWRDADGDGVTDAGELLTLADVGITSLAVSHDASVSAQNGNLLNGQATVTHTDGSTTQMTDAWFATSSELPLAIDLTQVLQSRSEPLLANDGTSEPLLANANLTNGKAEVLQIKASDLLQLPTANGIHQLQVLGDASDEVRLDSLLADGQATGTWSQAGTVVQNGHTFNMVQHTGDQTLQVLIDQHIAQSNVHMQ